MSTILRAPQLGWKLLPGVLAACVVVVTGALIVAAMRDDPAGVVDAGAGRAPVDIPAVPWKTDVYPVGAAGPLQRADRHRFEVQRDRVRTVVRNVAEAIVLTEGTVPRWVGDLLTPSAASALEQARTGIPKDATDVRMTARRARIGMQAPSMRAAAARASIEMSGLIRGRQIAWKDALTLWLERADGSWRVIAFDVDRTQLP